MLAYLGYIFIITPTIFIDIAEADATVAADKKRILDGINADGHGGVENLNQQLRTVVRSSAYASTKPYVQNGACGDKYAVEEVVKNISKAELTTVVTCNYVALLESILQAGTDVNMHEEHTNSALSIAVDANYIDCMKLLLRYKCNMNVHNCKTGATPLTAAVERGNIEQLKLLLEYEPDLNYPDTSGRTPFIVAAEKNQVAVLEMLLKYSSGRDIFSSKTPITPGTPAAVGTHHNKPAAAVVSKGTEATAASAPIETDNERSYPLQSDYHSKTTQQLHSLAIRLYCPSYQTSCSSALRFLCCPAPPLFTAFCLYASHSKVLTLSYGNAANLLPSSVSNASTPRRVYSASIPRALSV